MSCVAIHLCNLAAAISCAGNANVCKIVPCKPYKIKKRVREAIQAQSTMQAMLILERSQAIGANAIHHAIMAKATIRENDEKGTGECAIQKAICATVIRSVGDAFIIGSTSNANMFITLLYIHTYKFTFKLIKNIRVYPKHQTIEFVYYGFWNVI